MIKYWIPVFFLLIACENHFNLANNAPKFLSTPTLKPESDGSYSYQLNVSDPENDSILIEVQGLPAWLTYDASTKTISGIASISSIGEFPISIILSDGKLNSQQDFTITVNYLLNDAPPRAAINQLYEFNLLMLGIPQSITINQKPDWIDYNNVSQKFSGTPGISDQQNEILDFTINDALKGSINYSFNIDIAIRFSSQIDGHGQLNFITDLIQRPSDSIYVVIIKQVVPILGGFSNNIYISTVTQYGTQIWDNFVTSGTPESLLQLANGNYLFCGHGNGAIIGEINQSTGNLIWSSTYAESEQGFGSQIIETSDNKIVMIGSVNYNDSSIYNDLWILKVDENGTKLWENTFGGELPEKGVGISEVSDGFILAGTTASMGAGQNDFYLIKTDLNGTLLWEKSFGGTKNDKLEAFLKAKDNSGFYLLGSTNSKGNGSSDVWLLKVDLDGNLLWEQTYGTENFERGLSLENTPDNGLMIAAEYRSAGNLQKNLRIIRTNSTGEIIANNSVTGADRIINSIKSTVDNGYILGGEYRNAGTIASKIWLLKIDENGYFD